ncbi:MAG: hypothetical protein NC310_05270 [Roseburia sp.]|nr:hypothetical protein [Anaeroplasma bactoclasticum]MCM1196470.1 hypothetical protein [Roseburia sp.]MCM1557882.1 hypothetical protein [Anaeroplasma bactoclasticum]
MKKILVFIFLGMVSLTVISCGNKNEEPKDFKQGDEVIKDGVIYTYYDEENLYEKEIPFVEEENYKSYYNYYYYDMSDVKNKKKITTFEGNLLAYDKLANRYHFNPIPFQNYLEKCDLAFSPSIAEYYRIKDYFSPNFLSNGFVITGYTKDLPKDVVIPKKVYDIKVIQIGYKAFENALMETFTFLTDALINNEIHFELIHPFAFSNCPNLVDLKASARVLSMGISNCPKLEKISYITPTSDCSLYNLSSLTSILDCNPQPIESFVDDDYHSKVCFYQTWGFVKSSIYLCPKLEKITGESLTRRNRVVYRGSFPYYAFDTYEIVLKDLYFIVKGYEKAYTITYNKETLELNLPYLNTGLNYTGEIYKDLESTLIEEKEDAFYITISYPKISEELTDWPKDDFNDPIVLKISKK